MNIDVDKIVVSLDVVAPDAVVVEASAVTPSGIVTEAVAELPTQVIVISHEETPTVTPLQIIDFGYSSIECAFDVATEQAEEVVKGVLCGTTNPPTFENADYRLLHGQGSMDLAFAGLNSNTEYYLRPYALSNLGYKYGDVVAQRTKVNPIPEEYQLVEYLQSSGTQYLRIFDNFNADSEVDIDFSCDRFVSSAAFGNVLFSAGNSMSYLEIWYTANEVDSTVVYRNSRYNSGRALLNVKCSLHITNSGVQWEYDGLLPMQTMFSNVSQSFNASGIDIFNIARQTTEDKKINGKLYHVAARLVVSEYNLYPVYRKTDNKPGMYDLVNNQFYTNQGTGEFTVGPDKDWEE